MEKDGPSTAGVLLNIFMEKAQGFFNISNKDQNIAHKFCTKYLLKIIQVLTFCVCVRYQGQSYTRKQL